MRRTQLATARRLRWTATLALRAAVAVALSACGGTSKLVVTQPSVSGIQAHTAHAGQKLGFPSVATKNTTRVGGGDPVADAAGVALAVYPSQAPGTHPSAVTLAPTSNWQAALASSVLMAPPIRAPMLLSPSSSLPSATASALAALAPSGSGPLNGAQVLSVGAVARPKRYRITSVRGSDPYALAAG